MADTSDPYSVEIDLSDPYSVEVPIGMGFTETTCLFCELQGWRCYRHEPRAPSSGIMQPMPLERRTEAAIWLTY